MRLVYWSMRVMAYLGGLSLLLAAWGAWLLPPQDASSGEVVPARGDRRDRVPIPLDFAGWILTEAGRQPWVAYGLQKTTDAVSPTATTFSVGLSLAVSSSRSTCCSASSISG